MAVDAKAGLIKARLQLGHEVSPFAVRSRLCCRPDAIRGWNGGRAGLHRATSPLRVAQHSLQRTFDNHSPGLAAIDRQRVDLSQQPGVDLADLLTHARSLQGHYPHDRAASDECPTRRSESRHDGEHDGHIEGRSDEASESINGALSHTARYTTPVYRSQPAPISRADPSTTSPCSRASNPRPIASAALSCRSGVFTSP